MRLSPVERPQISVVVVGIALVVALAVATPPSAAAAVRHSCGSVTTRVQDQSGAYHRFTYHDLTATGVSCRYAKSFVKNLATGGAPRGWTSKDVVLHRGKYRHEVIWHHNGGKRIKYKYSNSGR